MSVSKRREKGRKFFDREKKKSENNAKVAFLTAIQI